MINDYREYVAEKISRLRYAKQISSRDLSLNLGFEASYINKLENKKFICSIEKLSYICDYFGITLSEFFDDGNENPLLTHKLVKEIRGLNSDDIEFLINTAKQLKKKK